MKKLKGFYEAAGFWIIAITIIIAICAVGTSLDVSSASARNYSVNWQYYDEFKEIIKENSTAFFDAAEEDYQKMYEEWFYHKAFSDILVSEDGSTLYMESDDTSIYNVSYPVLDTMSDGVYYLYNGDEGRDATVVISTKDDMVKLVYTARFIDGLLSQYIVDDLKYDPYSGWYISQSEDVSMKWNRENQTLYIEDQNNEKEDQTIYMTGDYMLLLPY